ncbi:hypothetical protein L1887_09188 [Cichorium endivia]|nr:hypothetical protein L1887_09188 [Cichorium endivia]
MLIIVVVLMVKAVCVVAIRCPDCGKTPVPYPLSTTPSCGHQSYKIRCDMGVLKFDTVNNTYPIISISPKNQRLVIGQSHLLPNTCVMADFVSQGIQLNNSLPFTITLSNSVFFFNCTDATATGTVILDCTPTDICQAYLNGSPQMSTCRRTPRRCSFMKGSSTSLFSIPLKMEKCRAYSSFVNLNISLPISKWPDPGVELMWAPPPEPPCTTQTHCDSTSSCKDSHDGTRRCFCNPKFHWDANAGQCVKHLKKARAKRKLLVAITICSGGTIFGAAVFAITMFVRRQRIKAARRRLSLERQKIVKSSGGGKSSNIFTSKEIKKATNNFSSTGLLGVGGFGEVYKGVLDDGTPVAVKCAKHGNTKSIDQVLNEVTDKSDVYSFGVLLLEILTCQKVIDFDRPADDVNLVAYIKRIVNGERLVDAIDQSLKIHATSLEIDAMTAFGLLAMSCLEEHRENRPSMKHASEEIEYIMGIVATKSQDHGRNN